MKKFKCLNCGECCGPVPITMQEFTRIRAKVMSLKVAERKRIKAQKRGLLECPLRDKENKCCLVYEIRPWICRQYGHVPGMVCPHNPQVKLKSNKEADQDIETYMAYINDNPFDRLAGFMAIDIGWKELEQGLSNSLRNG